MRDTAGRASTERGPKKARSLQPLAGAGLLLTAGAGHAQTTYVPDPTEAAVLAAAKQSAIDAYNDDVRRGLYTQVNATTYATLDSTTIVSTESFSRNVVASSVSLASSQFSTEVIGNLVGRGVVFDQTFGFSSSGARFNSAVAAAGQAISIAAAPAYVRLAAPRLVSNNVAISKQAVTVDTFNGFSGNAIATSYQTFGPTTIGAGFIGVCSTLGVAATNVGPTGCTNAADTRFQLAPGQLATVINAAYEYNVTSVTTTTTVSTTTEVWEVDGIAALLGTIHAVVPVAGFDQAEGFAGRARAQATEATGRFAPWVEGWGQFNRTSGGDPAAGVAPGDTRNGYGLDIGASYAVNPMLRVGAAADHGHTDLRVPAAGERGSLDLTQVAGFGRVGDGTGPYIGFGGGYGWGHDRTSIAPAGATATASSRETLHLYWASGELGYRQGLGAVAVTPLIGATFTRVTQDGFVETGSTFNLASSGATNKRVLSWAGLKLDARLGGDAHPITLALSGRATHLGGDRAPTVAVGFAGSAADAPLLIAAPLQPRWGADLHAAVAYRLASAVDVFVASEADLRDGDRTVEARGGVRMHF